ncbi:MAG: gamma-glutamyl-gamma-aminobutyrate hydrolase family protein [Actinobacteria bacterium]|nr:MAG: gamma-glutamyl-gamma-aminobutyrate hydrolase family protein [Actinomycetota bacterium]
MDARFAYRASDISAVMARTRSKPVIGLSLGLHDFGDYAGVGFQRPIALAGGVGLILPRVDGYLDDALDACDGVLLGGGRDVDPSLYGQERTDHLMPTEPRRDAFELDLVQGALERGLPILGMCRGIQILNVALGGTLVQDMSLVAGWAEHPRDPGWKAWKEVEQSSLEGEAEVPPHPRHAIVVEPGSRLHAALRSSTIEVDSFHHQALADVSNSLRVVARAPDGVVEAVELDGDGYVLAVQWELQEEWRVDRRFLAPFEHFVQAARDRR